MEAGRELDALVAEKVMGLQVLGLANANNYDGDWIVFGDAIPEGDNNEPVFLRDAEIPCQSCVSWDEWNKERPEMPEEKLANGHYSSCLEVVPFYSELIGAAWQVVEKLFADGFEVRVNLNHDDYFKNECIISKEYWKEEDDIVVNRVETIPLAICLAALKAVKVEIEHA